MHIPTEDELEELYISAQHHSGWARENPHSTTYQDLADEAWQRFHCALTLYEEHNGTIDIIDSILRK